MMKGKKGCPVNDFYPCRKDDCDWYDDQRCIVVSIYLTIERAEYEKKQVKQ